MLALWRPRWFGSVLTVVVAAVVIVSCSNDIGEPPASTPPEGVPELVADPDLPRVGLAWRDEVGVFFSEDDNRRLYDLWQAQVEGCMNSRGFQYTRIAYPKYADGLDRVSPLDQGYALTLGYHYPIPELIDTNPFADEAFSVALEGTDSNPGCGGVSYDDVYGEFGDFILQVDAALTNFDSFIAGFRTTAEGERLVGLWSDCMATHGYRFVSSDEPRLQYAELPKISDAEIRTRTADLECDRDVGLTDGRSSYEHGRVLEWLRANEATVIELRREKGSFDQRLSDLEQSQP